MGNQFSFLRVLLYGRAVIYSGNGISGSWSWGTECRRPRQFPVDRLPSMRIGSFIAKPSVLSWRSERVPAQLRPDCMTRREFKQHHQSTHD